MKYIVPLLLLAFTVSSIAQSEQQQSSQVLRRSPNIVDDPVLAERLRERLGSIVLPDIDFNKIGLSEAVYELRRLTAKADLNPQEAKRGVNVVIKMDPKDIAKFKISSSIKSPTVLEAFSTIADQAGCVLVIQANWISLVPKPQQE